MICVRCGTSLPDEANFCLHCGEPTRRKTHIFAIANQQGRVGKTATAVNLGACLADIGRRTLIVDLSPNAGATTHLGVDSHKLSLSMYELLVNDGVTTADVLKREIRPKLSLLPSSGALWAADLELAYLDQREVRLRRALDPVRDQFDFVLIDCPSWLSILAINGLAAADGVILPLVCEYLALEGLQQILSTIKLVKDRLHPKIDLYGVVLTMYDPRTTLSSEVVREISEHFPKQRFQSVIPRNVRLPEALGFGATILEHDNRSPGALAYKALA